MALPPFDVGAVKDIVACALPAEAVPIVGEPGVVAGVTLLEAAEAAPVPVALVAVTENVYAVPLVRPVRVIGLAEPVVVTLPGEEVTL